MKEVNAKRFELIQLLLLIFAMGTSVIIAFGYVSVPSYIGAILCLLSFVPFGVYIYYTVNKDLEFLRDEDTRHDTTFAYCNECEAYKDIKNLVPIGRPNGVKFLHKVEIEFVCGHKKNLSE